MPDAQTVGRCGSCRWWQAGETRNSVARRGICGMASSWLGSAVHPESLAVATDEEGLKALLETAPEFGCAQWEKRDGD